MGQKQGLSGGCSPGGTGRHLQNRDIEDTEREEQSKRTNAPLYSLYSDIAVFYSIIRTTSISIKEQDNDRMSTYRMQMGFGWGRPERDGRSHREVEEHVCGDKEANTTNIKTRNILTQIKMNK